MLCRQGLVVNCFQVAYDRSCDKQCATPRGVAGHPVFRMRLSPSRMADRPAGLLIGGQLANLELQLGTREVCLIRLFVGRSCLMPESKSAAFINNFYEILVPYILVRSPKWRLYERLATVSRFKGCKDGHVSHNEGY